MQRAHRVRGKVVLITGASGGLGEQVAYAAAKRGAVVVATARRVERLQAVQERCRELSGGTAYAYALDVTDRQQVKGVLQRVGTDVGPVDVLVNSAGFGLFAEALDTADQVTEDMFQVNVLGLIRLCREVGGEMRKRAAGTSSTSLPRPARPPRPSPLCMQGPSSPCGAIPTPSGWS